jgi:Flp pilus assembly protein TadD
MPTNTQLYDEADRLKDAGDLEGAAAKLDALAVIYGRLKRHDDAIAHAERVCQLEPNDAFSYTALSVTYQRAGKIREAEDAKARAQMMGGMH